MFELLNYLTNLTGDSNVGFQIHLSTFLALVQRFEGGGDSCLNWKVLAVEKFTAVLFDFRECIPGKEILNYMYFGM